MFSELPTGVKNRCSRRFSRMGNVGSFALLALLTAYEGIFHHGRMRGEVRALIVAVLTVNIYAGSQEASLCQGRVGLVVEASYL